MTLDLTTLLGLSCIVLAISLIGFSRYRYWLVFIVAGMAFGGALELLRFVIQSAANIATIYAYLSASGIMLFGLAAFIVFYDIRYNSKEKTNCIEHTPVYKDEQQSSLS